MYDRRRSTVQKVESLEDLPTPVLQDVHVDLLETFYVTIQ